MTYDPRAHGALCDVCPLGCSLREAQQWLPVPPELKGNGELLVLGDHPRYDDVVQAKPFSSALGDLLDPMLEAAGVPRATVSLDHVIACRSNTGDMDGFIHQHVTKANQRIEADNKKARAAGLPEQPLVPHPADCCFPRLVPQLKRAKFVLALGAMVTTTLWGKERPLDKSHGSFNRLRLVLGLNHKRIVTLDRDAPEVPTGSASGIVIDLSVTPTYHPGYALSDRNLTTVVARGVERWGAWVHDRLSWREPLPWVEPRDATHLAQLLWDPEVLFASLDVEAAIGDPLITPPGLLGITLFYRDGRPELPLMFQFYSIEKNTNWTPRPDLHLLIEVLRVWAADKNRAKVWHNGGYYDQMSLLKLLGWFKGALDTIIIMRGVYPELRRALYMAGVLTTHVGAWKLAHDDRSIALEPSSDDEWKAYNVIDTHVTGRAFLPLVQKCVERGQWPAMELDHREQHVMVQMHRIGLPVNEQKRRAKEDEQAHKILALNSQIRHIIGDPNYNPNSTHQLARLIYDDWKVPISARTDTGAPSTSEDTLRSILVSGLLDPAQHACLDQHIILREVVKEFGTYTTVYRRQDDLSPYATDPGYTDWLKNPLSFDYKNRGRPGGLTWADGRIRPDYSVHGPKTGRRSSQHPNGHNAPASIREFVEPHDLDKYTLVYADYDQIEFRLVAAIAKITSFINVFLQGGDPHSMTALLIYADEFQKQIDASYSEAERAKALAKGVPIKAKAHPTQGWEELRVFAKSFIYLVFYGGGPRTAYQNLAVARNPDTKQLLFPNMTLSDVRRAYRMIMEQAPELPAWWESVWDESQRLGYITEGLLGRRRDFPTRDPNAELNMKIQAPAAIMAARANIAVSEAIPWDFNLGTGLLTETHDSLLLMVERERAEDVKGTVERLMFCEEFGMKFTAEAKLKRSWGDR